MKIIAFVIFCFCATILAAQTPSYSVSQTLDVSIQACVSTSDLKNVSDLRVAPNPINATLEILGQLDIAKTLRISCFDASGIQVFTNKSNYPAGAFAFSQTATAWPNGLYQIQIASAEGEKVLPILVQH